MNSFHEDPEICGNSTCLHGSKCEASIQKCTCAHFSCSKLPDHPVCGSDGHTYPTECHLLDDQCRYQRPILLASHSPCRGKSIKVNKCHE